MASDEPARSAALWVALHLGSIELWRGTPFARAAPSRGRWDFFWLSLLFGLTLTIALLMVSARQGVTDRLLDVSLSVLPGHGVPIWVRARTSNLSEALSPQDLEKIAAVDGGLPVYPYREVLQSDVALPGEGVWKSLPTDAYALGGKLVSDPIIWAVARDDPLWTTALADDPALKSPPMAGLPTVVILNRQAFRRFQCDAYTANIEAAQPMAKPPAPDPSEISADGIPPCLAPGIIYLNLKPGGRQELHPFRIVWVDRLPTFTEVAVLFSLDYLHALMLAQEDWDLRLFPELNGEDGLRVTAIEVHLGDQAEYDEAALAQLLDCLGTDWKRRWARIDLIDPRPSALVEHCASVAGLRFFWEPPVQDSGAFLTLAGTPLTGSPIRIAGQGSLLCVRPTAHTSGKQGACGEDSKLVAVDPIKKRDFETAMLYVPQRSRVFEVVKQLDRLTADDVSAHTGGEPEALVAIPGPYRDAINRLGFMAAVVDLFKLPFGFVLVLTLVVLSVAQIGIVVEHRQHTYGVYLAKGMDRFAIVIMLMAQVAVGYAFGLLLALGLVELASRWIEHDFGRLIASQAFADKITITDLSLLPLQLDNVLYIGGWGFGIVLAITVGLLWRLLLLRRIEPARLLIHD